MRRNFDMSRFGLATHFFNPSFNIREYSEPQFSLFETVIITSYEVILEEEGLMQRITLPREGETIEKFFYLFHGTETDNSELFDFLEDHDLSRQEIFDFEHFIIIFDFVNHINSDEDKLDILNKFLSFSKRLEELYEETIRDQESLFESVVSGL